MLFNSLEFFLLPDGCVRGVPRFAALKSNAPCERIYAVFFFSSIILDRD